MYTKGGNFLESTGIFQKFVGVGVHGVHGLLPRACYRRASALLFNIQSIHSPGKTKPRHGATGARKRAFVGAWGGMGPLPQTGNPAGSALLAFLFMRAFLKKAHAKFMRQKKTKPSKRGRGRPRSNPLDVGPIVSGVANAAKAAGIPVSDAWWLKDHGSGAFRWGRIHVSELLEDWRRCFSDE